MALPAGYKVRKKGTYGVVAATGKHWDIIRKDVLPQARAVIEASLEAWASKGPGDFPEQRFKFEKQYKHAGKMVRVEAFKARHVRVYGAVAQFDGKATFLITAIDTAKKQYEADQNLLNAAGKKAHELIHTDRR